jgi:hypothetical protein
MSPLPDACALAGTHQDSVLQSRYGDRARLR